MTGCKALCGARWVLDIKFKFIRAIIVRSNRCVIRLTKNLGGGGKILLG